MILVDLLGWLGTGLIVLAYGLVSSGKLAGKSAQYQLLNFFGALFLGINLLVEQSWPAFTLQVVWAAIAIAALVKFPARARTAK